VHQAAPNVPVVQEGIGQEVLQVAFPYHLVVGTAFLQGVTLPVLVVGMGKAAFLGVGRRPCVVVERAAYRQGPGAYRLAEGRVAFRWVALELSHCQYGIICGNYVATYDLRGP